MAPHQVSKERGPNDDELLLADEIVPEDEDAMKARIRDEYRTWTPDDEEIRRRLREVTRVLLPPESKKKQIYTTVREATYQPMSQFDLHEIRESYGKLWLPPEKVALLAQGRAQEFQEHASKGVFLFGFDEKPDWPDKRDAKPVFDQMWEAFERNDSHPDKYIGRILRAKTTGEILAWLTWMQTSQNPEKEYVEEMLSTLRTGVTGGQMQMTGVHDMNAFTRHRKKLLMFDTIASHVPYAGSRILAKATEEMTTMNSDLKYFILYRLYEILVHPLPKNVKPELRVGENDSSGNFFKQRDCKQFAIDANPNGPVSHRNIKRGTKTVERTVQANWEWMYGLMPNVLKKSRTIWNAMRKDAGDMSEDPLVVAKPRV